MSKMSQLAMELDEQAVELGFEDREDAMQNGYEVVSDGTFARLVKTETEQEEAHNAWLEERDEILENLSHLKNIYTNVKPDEDIIEQAITFIKEQCHD